MIPFELVKEKLLKHLNEKGIDVHCICGENKWNMVEQITMVQQFTGNFPPGGVETITMICENCGYIRNFAIRKFIK